MDKIKPKHTIRHSDSFQKGKESLGNLILKGMKTTGGTDVDWLVEHNGGFIIFEFKDFSDDGVLPIPIGQMIAYEKLYKSLTKSNKCFFLFIGTESIDFKNPNSPIWYFEMTQWNNLPKEKSKYGKAHLVHRNDMEKTSVGNFREMIEIFWKELEKN